MGFFDSMNVSASALTAERLRMDVISKNIANANVTRTASGGPYRREMVVFEASTGQRPFSDYLNEASKSMIGGVKVSGIIEDTSPFKEVYDPTHPDANAEGYVKMPNVDIMAEMVDMITATRSYEANVTAMNNTKTMALKALEIGR